jgi:hypothetical protein
VHEELGLAGEIVLPRSVGLEVIASQVREHPEVEAPLLGKASGERVARDLDRGVPAAALRGKLERFEKASFRTLHLERLVVERIAERRLDEDRMTLGT